MAAGRQLRLLLWKDYLTRKRNLVTLCGVAWAVIFILCVYAVRVNIENQNFPTCQFAARALPSAGLVTFLQSFICEINNECSPLNEFQEIPTYENAKLTQIQRQLSPLLNNDTILSVAENVPDALKLLGTLAEVADEPDFIHIAKNGLKVRDLFTSPGKVKRYLSTNLELPEDVANSVMEADLSLQGILKGNMNRCNKISIQETLKIDNAIHVDVLVRKLCALSEKRAQKILMDLIKEVNFSKYIKMIGDMYSKLSGDNRISQLGDTFRAVVRMTDFNNFVPPELLSMFQGITSQFSYVSMDIITKIMDLLKPTFGDTESYKTFREVTDAAVAGAQYMEKYILKSNNNNFAEGLTALALTKDDKNDYPKKDIEDSTKGMNNAVEAVQDMTSADMNFDVFHVLSRITSFINKWLPDRTKHDVLLYSTLLAKLMEGANRVIKINMHIEEVVYNVSLRNPEGVKVLVDLPPHVVRKGLEGLTDAERTQTMTSKISTSDKMFCDAKRIQFFFQISDDESKILQKKLCTSAWKKYISDMLDSFGIYYVKNNINSMASILIQETFGKSQDEQFYTIDHEFKVLKNFTNALLGDDAKAKIQVDWKKVFNVDEKSDFMKVVGENKHLGKQILITVHGALAKEVIKSNYLLELKLTPMLNYMSTFAHALNEQLDNNSVELVTMAKKLYPQIIQTVLHTALDENKTYKSLSTTSEEIFCHGVEHALSYVSLPPQSKEEILVSTICNISIEIERGLQNESAIAKAIKQISKGDNSDKEVDWNKLITSLKELYIKLDKDYTYLFEFTSYGMDESTKQNVQKMLTNAKEFWFSIEHMDRILHLGVKVTLQVIDLLDHDVFNLTDTIWRTMKYLVNFITGPLTVFNEVIKITAASFKNETVETDLPPRTVSALRNILTNIPNVVVDGINVMMNGTTDLEPVTALLNDPSWPCSNSSLGGLLPLSSNTMEAVKALETLLCLDPEFQAEWANYLNINNARTSFNLDKANTTTYPNHVFLTFSRVTESVLNNSVALLELVKNALHETPTAGSRVTLAYALSYVLEAIYMPQRNQVLRKFFRNLDTVLNSVDISTSEGSSPSLNWLLEQNLQSVDSVLNLVTKLSQDSTLSLNGLWEQYLKCISAPFIDEKCKKVGRATWINALKFGPTMLGTVIEDLTIYFREINDPDTTLLQIAGFTKKTGLYSLYAQLSEYIAVLVNSYFDYGFMNKIRRASQSEFWDCEEVVNAMVPPPGSPIQAQDIERVRPYVCPSLLQWLGIPTGENTLLDIVAKPQYNFFTLPASNLTSKYEETFVKAIEFNNLLQNISNERKISTNDIKIDVAQEKLEKFLSSIASYTLDVNNPSYMQFYYLNRKLITTNIYLTRIVAMTNKIANQIDKLKIENITKEDSIDYNKLKEDLSTLQKIFKQKPSEAIELHFDIFTDILWSKNNNYGLIQAMDVMCNDAKNNITDKIILSNNQKIKSLICEKNYKLIYEAVQNLTEYNDAKLSLQRLIRTLSDNNSNIDINVFEFLRQRQQVISSLKTSISYAYELGLPIYLKYLQSNIEHYNVLLSFMSGDDWWKGLRELYHGPKITKFLDYLEQSFDIAQDVVTNLDKIYLVRFMRDINVNQTDYFCQPNITLSDYIPDHSGLLSEMKREMLCVENKVEIFRDIPPLLFASQGYESELELSKLVNYESLNLSISKAELQLSVLQGGPTTPERPKWISDDKISSLMGSMLQLLSKETMTKVYFGIIVNLADAATLYLNNSDCTFCSQMTAWFKQLNLQLFKKQDYDNLLCRLQGMGLEDVHTVLKNDFHWDMAIKELTSTRNYTNLELNKSLREFLDQVKLHLLEDMASNSTKLYECLAPNVTKNEFGHVTLFSKILGHTLKMIRSQLSHLRDIEGVTDIQYLKQFSMEISHNLDIEKPLNDYLNEKSDLSKEMMNIVNNTELVLDVKDSVINLRKISDNLQPILESIKLQNYKWDNICKTYDCNQIVNIVNNNLNKTLIEKDLPNLQMQEFWKFNFLSNILNHVEELLHHVSRVTGVASKLDIEGLMEGRLDTMLDFLIQILTDDTLNTIVYSINGLVKELYPVLKGTDLEYDLEALSKGLVTIQQFKSYLTNQGELKVKISDLFSNPNHVEDSLSKIGINHTNFWSIAAPRIHAGYIQLKPILSANEEDFHIRKFVCNQEFMSQVLIPANVDVVTLDDVYGAIIEQFCDLSDNRAKQIIPALMSNLNFKFVLDKVSNILLDKLYKASNLTETEGRNLMASYPQMVSVLPLLQENVGHITETLTKEPLFQSLKDFNSLGNMLSSSEFLSSAGNMLCGKPFEGNSNHFYKVIAETKDFSHQLDPAQLEVLPTDFCRSLYKDVLKMGGGKIIWSFVKPLVMGRILYTPATPQVRRIIEKANSTFAQMSKLTNMVHSFANAFSSVNKLSEHREGVNVLRKLMTSSTFSEVRSMLIGDAQLPDVNVDGLFDEFGDLDDIGSLLHKASNLLHCINLDRFHATSDEDTLSHEAAKLTRLNEFSAGLVFTDVKVKGDVPIKVNYKIRMDIDSAPSTFRKKSVFWIPGPEASFLEDMRYFRGFIQIQDIVDKAIIELSQNHSRSIKKREIAKEKEDENWAVYTQQTPYPCYEKNFFQTALYESSGLIVAFFFSLLFTVASVVRFIVIDKESGNTMLMSVMGVNLNCHTLSWIIASTVEITITIICVTVVLIAGRILPRSDISLIFVFIMIYGFSLLMFCYMMSKIFKSASLGAVCSGLAYLVTFMPFVIILSLEAVISYVTKLVVCLAMSSAFGYSLLNIARYEATGNGAKWEKLWESYDHSDLSLGITAIMMIVDGLIYFAIGAIIDRFFGLKTLKSNITYCKTLGEKAGVSIVNITKIYAEGSRRQKVALDNVSIELHKGQITTLLGHNGAGKTTLIKIVTGMLKPTKGHIIVRSDHESKTRMGVCPQKDVLYEYMTAREHISLYAQLKSGLQYEQVKNEVKNMLRVLSLANLSEEPVCKLSGGTRRRLCVALAFVGEPHLVSLDEPTAGVDPSARRDIWSLIMKLKEDRTVLLTTHHLDEAELLSDQIVIMHKGQIHTTGSPIDIKRSLGNGYKLTVMYPRNRYNSFEEPLHDDEDISIEERTKQLLAVVRDVVKNAQVLDVNRFDVEIVLPLYDINGSNNNFLQLCTTLEERQTELGYKTYSMDCSSLEQVFANICQQADGQTEYGTVSSSCSTDSPSKSTSSVSVRTDCTPLVPSDGPVKGTAWEQFCALLRARYLHYIRNRWLLFLLIVLPSLFVTVAMAFSMIRPPPDAEVPLQLHPGLYGESTDFIVPQPSVFSGSYNSSFAQNIMDLLKLEKGTYRNWTNKDSLTCKCTDTTQVCDHNDTYLEDFPQTMALPDVDTLNHWLLSTNEEYIEKRYGGYTSSIKNNITNLVAWYNNKGYHAMPSYVNALHNAILQTAAGNSAANITTYTHPLKISKEQISRSTLLQHVADAGISCVLQLAYCLVTAGSAVYLVRTRRSQEKRLQLLCGVSPALYWFTSLVWDMIIIVINMVITVIVLEAFGFPVFVERNNLPAICILILLFGYACGNLVHLSEKLFTEASMANMVLFCTNVFIGFIGIATLLILDLISDSDETDHARSVLHKVFLVFPQFAFADAVLEIAKNTVEAQVLTRFGMDTYKDPVTGELLMYHYLSLIVVGTLLMLINLAVEYDCFQFIIDRFRKESIPAVSSSESEAVEVAAERKRVQAAIADARTTVRLHTIGNINAGFLDTETKLNSIQRVAGPARDVAQCSTLSKAYYSRVAVDGLTLGIPPGQCTALLGQNGAGKSTTFAMLTGELRPTAGKIHLNEKRVSARNLCNGLISYCPQSDAIDPLLTVYETLQFYCRLRGITHHEEVIQRTIEMFDLTRYAEVRNGTLSGGNKRKLCTAIAFMGRTPLVLLDEPTSGMDVGSRVCVSRGVRTACGGARAVLLSTHALHDARALAARVALMRAGRLCALASVDDCLHRFGGGYVVSCRTGGRARAAWRRVRTRIPSATLEAHNRATLQMLIPTQATVNNKEVTTRLSDIFRLMAELQRDCDVEDFTVNQSSLDQMFLSFTEKPEEELHVDFDLPSPEVKRKEDEQMTITSL